MELKDKDLVSIQEVRSLLHAAREAEKTLSALSQDQIDQIVKAVAEAGHANAEKLAKMAWEETGFGKWQDKVIKNVFGSKIIYEAIKDQKTIGIIREDKELKTIDIGTPVGVIAGIIPSTNPTSTVMYKTLIALKGGNAIVFSPHPGAVKCILETVRILNEAAIKAGCPEGAISAVRTPTLQATKELMQHPYTSLILATGGAAMVKSAYSSGTPAIGVGAGNGPAFIDRTADIPIAIKRIIDSKTFDNGTICASEQSIIIEKAMEEKVVEELKAQKAYILSNEESDQLARFILRANGTMNPLIVGKSVEEIARLAGLSSVPKDASVLVARENNVGQKAPYSHEKLAPILALFVEKDVDAVLSKTIEILHFEGIGHTFSMHTESEELVKRFALKVPASRILINTLSSLGGIGGTTNLFPALTLGCGAAGGSSNSNNIGPMDVINIKRAAYGVRELEEIKADVNKEYQTPTIDTEEMVEKIIARLIKELTA